MPRPLDSLDLAHIKNVAAGVAHRHRRPDWADDYTSVSCAYLMTLELPDEAEHRARFIAQTVLWKAYDFFRANCRIPRRLLGKSRESLSEKDQARYPVQMPLEDWDGAQSDAPEFDPESLESASRALASIGPKFPQEFAVLTLYFWHGMSLPDIGPVLGVTGSRAGQLYVRGLKLVQKRFQKQNT